jgi:tetratricopeptide (TPR) repeat protein
VDSGAGWSVGPDEREEPRRYSDGLVCAACGERNSDRARFCQACGAGLSAAQSTSPFDLDQGELAWFVHDEPEAAPQADEGPWSAPPEQPSTGPVVTAVVCEVSPRGHQADTEEAPDAWDAAGALEEMAAALQEIRAVLERHGGAVDHLAGSPNTLVAVFGPEPDGGDGPLRAVRAAAEIRQVLPVTSSEPTGDGTGGQDPAVLVRAGVGASEVLGSGAGAARLWEQRVVDLAVRLQRMAEPGEIIVGEGVYRRVGAAVEVQPVDGRARMDGVEPVGPLRLLDVVPDVTSTWLSVAPLVGRDAELARLRDSFRRVASGSRGALVWVVGESGIGKTRLVETFLEELEEDAAARVIRVRCRTSSDGGTMWPVADIVEQAAWVTDADPVEGVTAKLHRLFGEGEDAARATGRLTASLGASGSVASPEETPWAIRRLLEAAAPNGPLVLFVDDADRAGPGFSDLLAGVAEHTREAAVLIVLAGRAEPEHPARLDQSAVEEPIRIGPLADADMTSLVGALLESPEVVPEIAYAVASAARGNPLAAEHTLALLIDHGRLAFEHRRWVASPDVADHIPPGGALDVLEARIQALDPDHVATLGQAAALGETFPWSVLVDITPEHARLALADQISTLTARDILRPDVLGGEDAYSFRHSLIRGAVLATTDEEVRAVAHERFAAWLQASAGERPDRHAEWIGSHLESACRFRRGAGLEGPDGDLARRAAALLATAGATATGLGDRRGAVQLWLRASSLLDPGDAVQPQLLLETALLLFELGEHAMAEGLLAQAARAARTTADRASEWRTRLARGRFGLASGSDRETLDALRETADAAITACREVGDDVGLAWAWSTRGRIHRHRGHLAAAAVATERAAEHARRAGRDRDELNALREIAGAIADGPAPLPEAAHRCEEILATINGRRPAEQEVRATLAVLMARQGRIDEARALATQALEEVEALDLDAALATCLHRAGQVEAFGGQLEEAQRLLLRALGLADRSPDAAARGEIAASLAHVAYDLPDLEAALRFTEVAERDAVPGDVVSRVRGRGARAKVLAKDGRLEEAKAFARHAVQLADQTDLIVLRAGALLDLAEVLGLAGRPEEAAPFARKALRTLERKGAVGSAARARMVWEQVAPRPPERSG